MRKEFKGFHPKDANSDVLITLTDSGIEYSNPSTRAFQFIAYAQVAGFSGWLPTYGSLHIYSSNPNLTIHLNFPHEVAESYLREIQDVLKAKVGPSTIDHLAASVV
ncbi:hypothetical protein [Acaryochloris sp. IP29b_bin.137]|uniref:hypothetical protein n=1 Tax=Acaryochloris sp. IP29b_bin.137 TaxID=2969217 RepID=UPI00262999BC|nr:hypothetical protein [Acaryochloris sp. IP29b_bin.137]